MSPWPGTGKRCRYISSESKHTQQQPHGVEQNGGLHGDGKHCYYCIILESIDKRVSLQQHGTYEVLVGPTYLILYAYLLFITSTPYDNVFSHVGLTRLERRK